MSDNDLLRWRERFPILKTSVYLINNSLGAMPASVRDGLATYADLWEHEGVVAWNSWLPLVRETGNLIAGLIGAPSGSVIMHQNVSTLVSVVASCFDYDGPRRKVVYADSEFPTMHYFWEQQRRLGAEVQYIGTDDQLVVPLERLLSAIDDHTLIVPISHVAFRSSELIDVAAVVQKAHRHGASVLLDSYQATGAVPFDVTALGVDFVVGGSVKWLCGGPGAGYLYVRPDLVERLRPREAGWFSHARPFAFDMGELEYAPGIERFMGGTPGIPALYAAREGYRIVSEVGVERIRARSLQLTARLIARAEDLGLTVNTPTVDARRGGHVTIDFPNAEAVSQELIRRRFIIDYRPGAGIRVSPHFYNTEVECDAFMDELTAIRAQLGN
ncbi:MAG TPA: aminotransferase class V-fold PLP-dependent enzyme [Dehalococcoidia bacterium]|nr:aminotransferase class V-fold PLP-dependent enzyme [Dehalococcoidia bacterium]